MFRKKLIASGLLAALMATPALGKVSAEKAAELGKSLTAIGAEKAGNADGTIPAYEGGMKEPPACYKPGDKFLCHPFPDDKPLFTITRANLDKYRDKLSAGQIAMFEKYDTWKMPVYKTRRTSRVPEFIEKGTKINATQAELAAGGNGIKNFDKKGYPFPIPQNAKEVIWNHIMRYRGKAAKRITGQATPQVNGSYSIVFFEDNVAFRPYIKDAKPGQDENVMFYFTQVVTSPARLAGNIILVHETIDQVKEPRKAWIYNAGQRRVRRAPQVAYDGPGTAADGLRTADNFDMYNGAPDRYTWKLIGKQEMYIPYNNYKLDEQGLSYDDIIKPGHINMDLARYELHRVWKLEAKLNKGTRHIYGARTFYIDEDSWQAAVIDLYDQRGNLWRLQEAYHLQFYTQDVPWYALENIYDLQNGRYLTLGLDNNEGHAIEFYENASIKDFKPSALRRKGVR